MFLGPSTNTTASSSAIASSPPLNSPLSSKDSKYTRSATHTPVSPIAAQNSNYSPSTTIETWLIDIKLEKYIPYFKETLEAETLYDILPYVKKTLTKDDLLREWEELDFKSKVSTLHQIKIAKEMSQLSYLI